MKFSEECLRTYLAACDSALQQSRNGSQTGDGDTQAIAQDRARRTWTILQQARLFAIPQDSFKTLYQAADRYTTTKLAGLNWEPYTGVEVSAEESEKLIKAYNHYGPMVPFPEPLPFDSIFLSYGENLVLPPIQFRLRVRSAIEEFGITKAWLYGHVLGTIGSEPFAATVLAMTDRPQRKGIITPPDERAVALVTTYHQGEWYQPHTLDCWVLTALKDLINDHKELRLEPVGLGMKMMHKSIVKKSKQSLPLPRPYYSLILKDNVIDAAVKRCISSRRLEFSHRFDVRGHECIRVARGKLPLDPELESKLKKMEYRIYRNGIIATEDYDRLQRRKMGLPTRDEWLAVKNYWREAHIRGNPDLPYVPALRAMK